MAGPGVNERERLRRQRAEARGGSTIDRVGRVRREPDPATQPSGLPRRRRGLSAVVGPLALALAAVVVLGALGLGVFARPDEAGRERATATAASLPSEAPVRTPLRGLTGGLPSTPSATPSSTASATARPTSTAATPSPPATPSPTTPTPATPTPRPTTPRPTTPPPETFTASVEICREVVNGECLGRVTSVRPGDEWVVLFARLDGASEGDVIGFDISGAETFHAGSVTLPGGGSGIAYVELYTRDLSRGDYTVTLTRNGEPVASTRFEKRGGGG